MTRVAELMNSIMNGHNLAVQLEDRKRLLIPRKDLKLVEAVQYITSLLECEEVIGIDSIRKENM